MPKKIRLSADYQCYPLWWDGGDNVGEINPETLPLKPETVARLEKWAEIFDSWMDLNDAPHGYDPDDKEFEDFDKEGIALLKELQCELAPDYEVVYHSKKSGEALNETGHLFQLYKTASLHAHI